MKKIKLFYIGLIILQSSYAQTKSKVGISKRTGVSKEKIQLLQNSLHTYVDKGNLAGIQTAIVQNKSLIYYDSYGYASLSEKKEINENSLFRIFSMTKPIVSVALMQLYEQGKFDLNDSLATFVPEFKNMLVYHSEGKVVFAKKPIRIIDLLRHSSGIIYGNSANEALNRQYRNAAPRAA